MIDPKLVLILLVLSGGVYVTEHAVEAVKKFDRKVVHVVKDAGKRIAHVFKGH